MKAIVQDRYGSPEVLEFRDVEKPEPGDHEVLVRVVAASVNARDWHVMRGDPYIARPSFGWQRPKERIRGTDFAGRVEAVGAEVTRLRPGDEVFGEAAGAFAEYITAPDNVVDLKPANLTFEEAAAVPLAANTALMGLRDIGQVQPGQRILVNGASGGVGTFAIQIGKWLGAEVTGICSTRNADLVRSIGAEDVIDYTRDDFTQVNRSYDLLLDLVGNRALKDLRRVVVPTGKLVLSGGGVSRGGSLVGPLGLIIRAQLSARFVSQQLLMLPSAPSVSNLATLRQLAESGDLTPVIDRGYPLSEAAEAIRYLEVEHARAKVTLTA